LQQFKQHGAQALLSAKRDPKGNCRRSAEVVRQVIRHRFLDPQISPEVIAQKIRLERCDAQSIERGVRPLLADKISGNMVGIWLPPAVNLVLGFVRVLFIALLIFA
jgi:hypothetical protein